MTKNEFKALAFRFGISAHYSGKQQTMFLRGDIETIANFLEVSVTKRVWNFAVKAS